MRHRETTVRSRELGAGLRRLLDTAGLSGSEAARQLGWSQSELSRLLSGKRTVDELELATVLGACRANRATRAHLLHLCREANKRGWWQQHGSRLPKQLRTLIDHEEAAISIGDYQASFLSGLLQTSDYARAVISRVVNVPEDEVDDRVASRLARQNLLSREDGARYTFFMHEFVLRLPVGGAVVMSDQLHHLLRMSVRPAISLRVVPTEFGAHAGVAGSFTFMEFSEINPVIYLESETSTLFLEEPEESAAYRRILESLADTALSERQSAQLIRNLAVELYGSREDENEPP